MKANMSRLSKNSSTPIAKKKPDQSDVSWPSKKSNTPKAQRKPNQIDDGTMKFEIEGLEHQIIPTQANQHSEGSLTINNSYKAPRGKPTHGNGILIGTGESLTINNSYEASSGKPTITKGMHSARQFNPTQTNQNSEGNLTINKNIEGHKAAGGNPTRDIPTGTSQKGK